MQNHSHPSPFFGRIAAVLVSASLSATALAQDLIWNYRSPTPTANRIESVTVLNDRFAAVGELGTLITSTDGLQWTPQPVPISTCLTSIAYGNGRYVLASIEGELFTSTNISTWQKITSPFPALNPSLNYPSVLAFGNGRFVAASQPGGVATSNDGLVWRMLSVPGLSFHGTRGRTCLLFADGKFLLLGERQIWTSLDAQAWNSVSFGDTTFDSAAYGNDRFVVGGYDNSYSSPDGVNWTASGFGVTQLKFVNGVFYARDRSNNAVQSTDGNGWSPVPTNSLDAKRLTAVYHANRYVSVSEDPFGQIFTSIDGTTWTSPYKDQSSGPHSTVAYGNGIYVASGRTSSDGLSWTTNAFTPSDLPDSASLHVQFCRDRFFFFEVTAPPNRSLAVYTSLDGHAGKKIADAAGIGVAYGNGKYVITTSTGVLISSDGETWTSAKAPGGLSSITFGNGLFVCTNSGTLELFTSPDGLDWTARDSTLRQTAFPQFLPLVWIGDVTFGRGRFVATAGFTSKSLDGWTSYTVVSEDGITWRRGDAVGISASGLAFVNNVFVCSSGIFREAGVNSFLYISSDGYSWEPFPLQSPGLDGIAGADGVLVGSSNGKIVQTTFRTASAWPNVTLNQPGLVVVAPGTSTTISAIASGDGPFSYRWWRGTEILSHSGETLTLTNLTEADAGEYHVEITDAHGHRAQSYFTLSVEASRLVNLSARGFGGTGEDTLIEGFVLSGSASADSPNVLVRSIGPTLTTMGLKVSLADPAIRVLDHTSSLVAENDNWSTPIATARGIAATATDMAEVGAFSLPAGSRDSAVQIHEALAGPYTALVSSVAGDTSVVLNEIYGPTAGPQRLVNLSARARVGTGDNVLIAGFVISGHAPMKVLIRGVGPTLVSYGITHPLGNPKITLFNSAGQEIHNNDNWPNAANVDEIRVATAAVGAFSLKENSLDAVMLETLQPGVYTVHITGADGGSGVALVEIYEVP